MAAYNLLMTLLVGAGLCDVTFIGHGAPEHRTIMYLNGGCASQTEPGFKKNISQAKIQPNRTWSMTVTLPLPCIMKWKWRADNDWEWQAVVDRYTNLSTGSNVIYSNFGQDQEVTPKEVLFVGNGAPADKTTMYLNAACGSSRIAHFVQNMSNTRIQSDGTWSLRATLLLPCTLKWKWRADDMWERKERGNREDRLPAGTSVIRSKFNGDKCELKKEVPVMFILTKFPKYGNINDSYSVCGQCRGINRLYPLGPWSCSKPAKVNKNTTTVITNIYEQCEFKWKWRNLVFNENDGRAYEFDREYRMLNIGVSCDEGMITKVEIEWNVKRNETDGDCVSAPVPRQIITTPELTSSITFPWQTTTENQQPKRTTTFRTSTNSTTTSTDSTASATAFTNRPAGTNPSEIISETTTNETTARTGIAPEATLTITELSTTFNTVSISSPFMPESTQNAIPVITEINTESTTSTASTITQLPSSKPASFSEGTLTSTVSLGKPNSPSNQPISSKNTSNPASQAVTVTETNKATTLTVTITRASQTEQGKIQRSTRPSNSSLSGSGKNTDKTKAIAGLSKEKIIIIAVCVVVAAVLATGGVIHWLIVQRKKKANEGRTLNDLDPYISYVSNGGDGTRTPHLSSQRHTVETIGLDDIATESNELYSIGEEVEVDVNTGEGIYSLAEEVIGENEYMSPGAPVEVAQQPSEYMIPPPPVQVAPTAPGTAGRQSSINPLYEDSNSSQSSVRTMNRVVYTQVRK